MNTKFKTLLKTSAALATLLAGSQSWGAAFVSSTGTAFSETEPAGGVYTASTAAAITVAATTLEKGKQYTFKAIGGVTFTSLTLSEGTSVIIETAGDITLTAAALPSNKKAKIVFDNAGVVTWTANPTNTCLLHNLVFGKACTGVTGVATSVNAVLEVLNPDFAVTTGPTTPYFLKSTSVALTGVGTDVIHLIK